MEWNTLKQNVFSSLRALSEYEINIERWHLSNRNWLTCTSWTLSGCVGLSGSTPDWYKFIVMARPISVFQESVSQLLVKSTTVSQPLCSRGIRWKNRHVSKNPHCMYVWICVCVCVLTRARVLTQKHSYVHRSASVDYRCRHRFIVAHKLTDHTVTPWCCIGRWLYKHRTVNTWAHKPYCYTMVVYSDCSCQPLHCSEV